MNIVKYDGQVHPMGDCEAVIGLDGRKEERVRVSQRSKTQTDKKPNK